MNKQTRVSKNDTAVKKNNNPRYMNTHLAWRVYNLLKFCQDHGNEAVREDATITIDKIKAMGFSRKDFT